MQKLTGTDIITSSSDTVACKDLTISVAMGNSIALCSRAFSEHHTAPKPDFQSAGYTFDLLFFYSFN